MKSLRVVALACVLFAGALPSFAQQSVDYASISGRVTDASGAVVPGAQVTAVTHKRIGLARQLLIGKGGSVFHIFGWAPTRSLCIRRGFRTRPAVSR